MAGVYAPATAGHPVCGPPRLHRPGRRPRPRQTTIACRCRASVPEIVVVLLLLLANGVFAMSEIAVVAARKVRLQQRADDGDDRAAAALALAHEPDEVPLHRAGRHHAGRRAGRRLRRRDDCRAARSSRSLAGAAARALRARASRWAWSWPASPYLSLIIGELVPKRIGLNNPETIASWVARPMMVLARIGGPIVALLTGVDQPGAARVRHQGRRRAAPDRRRDQGADQPGRRDRRASAPPKRTSCSACSSSAISASARS